MQSLARLEHWAEIELAPQQLRRLVSLFYDELARVAGPFHRARLAVCGMAQAWAVRLNFSDSVGAAIVHSPVVARPFGAFRLAMDPHASMWVYLMYI